MEDVASLGWVGIDAQSGTAAIARPLEVCIGSRSLLTER